MNGERGFTVEEIDTSTPHPARMYNHYLGGRDNYEADRVAAQRVMDVFPNIGQSARANRAFLCRGLRAVAEAGVDQVIDLGTGIPTSPNTHEVVRETLPGARVLYVDNDPIVATHAGARLTNTPGTGFVLADVRDPRSILEHPVTRELIDFDRPVAVCMVAVLHFVGDEEDPAGIVRAFTDALPTGSALLLSHGTTEPYEGFAEGYDAATRDGVEKVYETSTARVTPRSRAAIGALFAGLALQEPGLVPPPLWRPDGVPPSPREASLVGLYAGLGRKD